MSTTRQPRFFEMNRYTSVIQSAGGNDESGKTAASEDDGYDGFIRKCLNCWGLCDSGGTCETIWQTITCQLA